MKNIKVWLLSLAVFCANSHAQVPEPGLYQGDGWFYTTMTVGKAATAAWVVVDKIQEQKIITLRSNGQLATYKKPWTLEQLKLPNGSTFSFSPSGLATPYSFPLNVGDIQTGEIRANSGVSKDSLTRTQVEGWEMVTVSAGTFNALKINMETWTVPAGQKAIDYTATPHTRVTQWYVPEVKNYIKRVERNLQQPSVTSQLDFYVVTHAEKPKQSDIDSAMQHLAVDFAWTKAAELGVTIGTQLLVRSIEKKGYLSDQQSERVACVFENFTAKAFVDEVKSSFVEKAATPQVLTEMAKFMETDAGQQLSVYIRQLLEKWKEGGLASSKFDETAFIKNFSSVAIEQMNFFGQTSLGTHALKMMAESPKHVEIALARVQKKITQLCIEGKKT
jgi:hypothetical protein